MYTENMKRKVAKVSTLRLSPNEEASILKQERERRRKLRLQQVREQEKFIAQQIRQDVKERRDQQLQLLAEDLRAKWEAAQAEKLQALEQIYLSTLSAIGEGHRQAKENEPDLKAIETAMAANKETAEKRHREALKELKQHKEKQLRTQTWHLKARKKALDIEKDRAAKIASLPPPPPDPLQGTRSGPFWDTKPPIGVPNSPLVNPSAPPNTHKPLYLPGFSSRSGAPSAQFFSEAEDVNPGFTAKVSKVQRMRTEADLYSSGFSDDGARGTAAGNIEVAKRLPVVKVCNVHSFSTSHYHLPEAYVDREMDTEQIDARSAAVEEEKKLIALQQEEERDRREQMEKANLRGSHALKMVQLAQDRDRLMNELEQMQQDDLSRRRRIVANMPQQLFEPAYRRAEIREEWQREMESAFENMYTRNTKMRGDMVLQLKPQPLPDPSVTSVDEDLDLTVEPEAVHGVEQRSAGTVDISSGEEHQEEASEPQSKQVLKRLLNRIRTQKDQWHAKAETPETVSDTLESGSLPGDQEEENKSVIDSAEVTDNTVLAGKSVLLHPQEQAVRIRMEAERRRKVEELERQKQEQLELISKLEEERRSLEAEFQKMRMQVKEEKQESSVTVQRQKPEPEVVDGKPELGAGLPADQICGESAATVTPLNASAENVHIQMIREYQQRLIQQNRIHQQSVDEARRRLWEYQLLLKNRYPHLSTSNVGIPDQGQETTKRLQRPAPSSSENSDASAVLPCPAPDALMSSPGHPRSTEKQISVQSMLHSLGKIQPISPRGGKMESIATSVSDVHVVDSCNLRAETPVGVDSLHHHFLGRRSPQRPLLHSPSEDRVQDTAVGSEKLSSTSSPGEHDSSSATSYFPLPSMLSLGLSQIDFSEPSSSFTVPKVGKRNLLPLGDFSNVQEFRERLLSSAAEIRDQQDHLKEMQVQLDKQRESLLSKQKNQEQHLLHRQKDLENQIRRHQESLEELLGSPEPRQGAVPEDLHGFSERERYQFMSALLKALDDSEEEVSEVTNFESSNGFLMRPPGRDQKWRSTKPPVTKTKLGPFLQQHELSAIMEVETPSGSVRRSSAAITELKESLTGQNNRSGHSEPVSYHPDVSRMSSDTSEIHGDLSRLSVSISNETPNQSRGKLSWRDTLSLEGSRDQTGGDRSFTPVLHKSLHESLPSNRITLPTHLSMAEGASGLGPTGHGRSPNSVCDYLSTTTISSGSFLTSEKTESSPGNSDTLSDLQTCNYSAIEEHKDSSSSPSSATSQIPLPTTWSHYFSPLENRSHIQQIIEKYTKDLSASLERNLSFHSPEVAPDISPADLHLSNTFHALDPKPDFNTSTPSYAQSDATSSPQNMADLSQSSSVTSRPDKSSYTIPALDLPHSMLALSASFGSIQPQGMGTRSPRRQTETDFSGSFLPLLPECTLNEPNVSSQEEPSYGGSALVQDQGNPLRPGVSQSFSASSQHASHTSFTRQPPSIILTSAAEDTGSFHELVATQMTVNDSNLSEHPISESLGGNSVKSVHFEELPAVQEDQVGEFSTEHGDPEEGSSQPASQSPDQTPGPENMTPASYSRSSLLSSLTIGSSASSLPSFVRTWDSESMRGILEEPDLTLLSLNDSSIVCSEPPVTQTTERQDGDTSQGTFHSLQPEVDASGFHVPDQSSVGLSGSQQFAEMSLEFTSTPGSLQEAFLKKKRHFIENSSKRVQEIKKKDKVSEQESRTRNLPDTSVTQTEQQQPGYVPAPADGGQLKKVVEVRVCTPEDRKLSEVEMHQRTIRLYNQLDEVKTRREEKMRQETYAKNREKAKEFKKRTLEKLRAKR